MWKIVVSCQNCHLFAELDLKQRILRMGFRFVPKDFNHGDCKKTGNVFPGKQLDMSTGAKGDNAIRKAPSDHFHRGAFSLTLEDISGKTPTATFTNIAP